MQKKLMKQKVSADKKPAQKQSYASKKRPKPASENDDENVPQEKSKQQQGKQKLAAPAAKKSKPAPPKAEQQDKSDNTDDEQTTTNNKPAPAVPSKINVSAGFEWDNLQFSSSKQQQQSKKDEQDKDEDEETNDEEQQEATSKKQAKNLRKKEARIEEHVIAERERELLSGNVIPESDADFERLLISQPSSSYLWIQFMAFKLGLTDIDGARKIAERALKAIKVTESQEVYNVHAALMNLEAKFGNDQTQKRVFERATQYCANPKQVYLQQAKIYEEQMQNFELAEEFYKKTVKKFNKSRKCWEAYEVFELKRKNTKRANEILERSLLSLPKHKHIKAITKFAQLHYKLGSIVQANKLLESIVQSYPSRTDIWSMFIDAELRAGRIEQTRSLFERVCALKLSTKKMKSFLQRYLKFEQEHGNEETQEHVKELARQYIAAKTA